LAALVVLLQPDDDTAESRDRQIKRHAHAANAAADHDAFAVKIHNPPALVGRFIGGLKAHRQRERVEPRCAARPGSDPAGFHLTPRKTRPLPGCCRPVAATMPDGRRNPLKIPG
jgi:hypothetical protein